MLTTFPFASAPLEPGVQAPEAADPAAGTLFRTILGKLGFPLIAPAGEGGSAALATPQVPADSAQAAAQPAAPDPDEAAEPEGASADSFLAPEVDLALPVLLLPAGDEPAVVNPVEAGVPLAGIGAAPIAPPAPRRAAEYPLSRAVLESRLVPSNPLPLGIQPRAAAASEVSVPLPQTTAPPLSVPPVAPLLTDARLTEPAKSQGPAVSGQTPVPPPVLPVAGAAPLPAAAIATPVQPDPEIAALSAAPPPDMTESPVLTVLSTPQPQPGAGLSAVRPMPDGTIPRPASPPPDPAVTSPRAAMPDIAPLAPGTTARPAWFLAASEPRASQPMVASPLAPSPQGPAVVPVQPAELRVVTRPVARPVAASAPASTIQPPPIAAVATLPPTRPAMPPEGAAAPPVSFRVSQGARPDFGVPEPAPLDPARQDTPRTDPTRIEAPKPGMPSAQPIARQIADALPPADGPGFDLALSPEELGQVRLRLISVEGGSLLMIQAERPETLDLMRRHIGTLEQELRDLGHDGLELRFSSSSGGDGGAQRQPAMADPAAPPSPQAGARPGDSRDSPPTPAAPRAGRDHLDLRL